MFIQLTFRTELSREQIHVVRRVVAASTPAAAAAAWTYYVRRKREIVLYDSRRYNVFLYYTTCARVTSFSS